MNGTSIPRSLHMRGSQARGTASGQQVESGQGRHVACQHVIVWTGLCEGLACCGVACVQQCQAHQLTVLEIFLDALNLEALATAQNGRQAGRWQQPQQRAAWRTRSKCRCAGWCRA